MTRERNRYAAPEEGWRLPIIPPPGTGIVTPACEDRGTRYPVTRHVGRMLRIGGDAHLCFGCGPEGGVYHPDCPSCEERCGPDCAQRYSMEHVRQVAEQIFLHDGDGSEPPTPAEIAAFDTEMRSAFGIEG